MRRKEDEEAHAALPEGVNEASNLVIGAAIEVHRHLGPGLLESVYERALTHELELRGLSVQRQVPVTVHYKGLPIEGQRVDMIVDPGVVLELKAVERLAPIHEAQLISYLRASGCRLGLLINFNTAMVRNGIKRIIK